MTTELGFTNAFPGLLSAYSQWDQFEQVPELLWPDAIRTYTRMWREESRLASVYYAIALPIMQTQWRIDPNGAPDNVVQHVSDDLGLPIVGEDPNKPRPRTKGRFSWLEHLQWAMRHLHFGHAVFEQVYRPDSKNPDLLRLRKLAPRPQSTIAFWNVDADGGLVGIQQWPPGTGFGGAAGAPNFLGAWAQEIPVNRLVVYTRDRDPGVWTGNSIFRPAYKNWLLKDELIRIEATAARRNGVGVPVVTAPPDVSAAVGSDGLLPYLKIAQQYRGGNNAGVALPNGAELELAGTKGQLPSGFIRQAIEYHDKQMALAALAHFLNLDRGGSFALASVQADTFSQGVQQTAETVRDTAQTHIVEDLVDTNFGEDSPAPRIVFDAIGSQQDASAAALQMLVNAGIITPDPQLEAFERQSMGLPGVDPDTQGADEDLAVPDNRPPLTEPLPTTQTPDGMAFTSRARVTASRGRRPRVTISSDGDLTLW